MMSDVRFAGTGPDRRRRMLATDFHSSDESLSSAVAAPSIANPSATAFPLLSRDQVMRKIISPRIWKHNVVACLLIAFPFILAGFQFPGQDRESLHRMAAAARGLCGLELFIASQLCLLICWVRAASAVDFAGVFRAWRWMSLILATASLLMLTGITGPLTLLLVEWLKPLVGHIQAARPALVFVPLCGASAYVLRHVIPDMGRCRIAQGSLVIAVVLTISRIIVGLRGHVLPVTSLELLELLTCGLILSSIHLHCRYVVYVNPNPPAAEKPVLRVTPMLSADSIAAPEPNVSAENPAVSLVLSDLQQPDEVGSSSEPAAEDVAGDVPTNDKSSRKSAGKSAKTSKAKQRRAG